MSEERTYYCDGPGCEVHGRTASPRPYLPYGFLGMRQDEPGGAVSEWHFCTWDCAMKYGATLPPSEVIEP